MNRKKKNRDKNECVMQRYITENEIETNRDTLNRVIE